MSLAIIIVNYRTAGLVVDCLRSLAPQMSELRDGRVIVVDNGSGDGSVACMKAAAQVNDWPWLSVVALDRNLGFAAGNNRGLAQAADAEFVLLLNSDTVVHEGCLQHCLHVMAGESDIGVMSCMLVGGDGRPQVAARRFLSPARQYVCALGLPWRLPRWFAWAHPQQQWDRRTCRRDADWVAGAFMLCRGELLRRLGGMDEDFFFYGEDFELCHRVRRAGYRVHYDPRASITHLGGGSSDPLRMPSSAKARHEWRARYLVSRKCYGRLAALGLRAVDLLNYGVRTLFYRLRDGRRTHRYRYAAQVLTLLTGRL